MDIEKALGSIREEIEADDEIREKVLPLARNAVRKCSEAIKHTHRQEFKEAHLKLGEASEIITTAAEALKKSQYLEHTQPLDTAYQELAEASNVLSIIEKNEFTPPSAFSIPSRPYLTGLADTIGELRRAALDSLRVDKADTASSYLAKMEAILEELHAFDFPNALIPDLRRKCDVARALIERTRADVTTAIRQDKLVREMRGLSTKKED
jgi:translin